MAVIVRYYADFPPSNQYPNGHYAGETFEVPTLELAAQYHPDAIIVSSIGPFSPPVDYDNSLSQAQRDDVSELIAELFGESFETDFQATLGRTHLLAYDDLRAAANGALATRVPTVGPAWKTSGGSLPVIQSGSILNTGSGYAYLELPEPATYIDAVTTEVLARKVKALIDALIGHGLIGA